MSHPAADLLGPRERVVAGLMSGTSLDGVDAAIVRLAGSGREVQVETLGFACRPYPADLRTLLAAQVEAATSDVRGLAVLHAALAELFAEVAQDALDAAGLTTADLDLVGNHGQTVQHVPEDTDVAGYEVRATLQIGDPARLAARLGVPVIADFRSADVALGGQGAPLAPYLDDCLFAHAAETRGLLNLGGIANLTVLPAGGDPGDAFAFDTGPANMVTDALALRLTGEPFDRDGALAARGSADLDRVRRLLTADVFRQPPPKSTGREAFGREFVDQFVADGPSDPADLLATALALTALSIADAVERFVPQRLDRVIASGGGVRNPTLLALLSDALAVPVETTEAYGLDPEAKEAVLFALLAHEWANGVRTGLPRVTGASRPAVQGALYLP